MLADGERTWDGRGEGDLAGAGTVDVDGAAAVREARLPSTLPPPRTLRDILLHGAHHAFRSLRCYGRLIINMSLQWGRLERAGSSA